MAMESNDVLCFIKEVVISCADDSALSFAAVALVRYSTFLTDWSAFLLRLFKSSGG